MSQEVIHAAYAGDATKLKQLLEAGEPVDAVDQSGYTALHWATCQRHTPVVAALLDKGADVNAVTQDGRTAVHFAAVQKVVSYGSSTDTTTPTDQDGSEDTQLELLNLLLSKKPDLSLKNATGRTALHVVAGEGSPQQLVALLAAGAAIDATDMDGVTPLMMAVSNARLENVKVLVASGANIDLVDEDKRTALQIASELGQAEVMALLMEVTESMAQRTQSGSTVLHLAAKVGQTDLVEQALRRGVTTDEKNVDEVTPLHRAAEFGHPKVVGLLVDSGADVCAADVDGATALHVAVASQHTEAVKTLLGKGADVNAKDLTGLTPLHLAAVHGHWQDMQLLAEAGADLNAQDKTLCTPLHLAVSNNRKEAAQKLLELGADVNAVDEDGSTALHLATQNSQMAMLDLLLTVEGLDPNIKDQEGCTAASIALKNHSLQLANKLIAAGAQLDETKGEEELHKDREAVEELRHLLTECIPVDERVPPPVVYEVYARKEKEQRRPNILHDAARNGKIQRFYLKEVLTKYLTAKDHKGRTPLHIAARYGRAEIVEFILDKNHKASFIGALSDDRRTAIELASENGHTAVVDIIERYSARTPEDLQARQRPDLARISTASRVSFFDPQSPSTSRRQYHTDPHGQEFRTVSGVEFPGRQDPSPPNFGGRNPATAVYQAPTDPVFHYSGYLKISSVSEDRKNDILAIGSIVEKVIGLVGFVSTDRQYADMAVCVQNTHAVLHGLMQNPASRQMMTVRMYSALVPCATAFGQLVKVMGKRSIDDRIKYRIFTLVYPLLKVLLDMGLALEDFYNGRAALFRTPEMDCRQKIGEYEVRFFERIRALEESHTVRNNM